MHNPRRVLSIAFAQNLCINRTATSHDFSGNIRDNEGGCWVSTTKTTKRGKSGRKVLGQYRWRAAAGTMPVRLTGQFSTYGCPIFGPVAGTSSLVRGFQPGPALYRTRCTSWSRYFSLNPFRNRRMWQVLGMVDTNLGLAYIDGGRRGNIDDRPVDAVARLSFTTIEVTCWIDKTFKTNRI